MSRDPVKDFVDGYVKAAREGGRSPRVHLDASTAYVAGKTAALRKFAKFPLDDKLDLAGLGLLGAPLIHDIVADTEHESPAVRRAKKITELAGLATLAASTLTKIH